MKLSAGVATVNLTPPIGMWLTGFGSRVSPATGIHDELFAKAVVCEVDGNQVALVATDVIQASDEIVAQARNLVQDWTGIEPRRFLFNATHTHSGPSTYRFFGMGRYEEGYADLVARQVATAVKLAQDRLEPGTLRFGTDRAVIGANRRSRRPSGGIAMTPNPDGAYDPTVYTARLDLASGETAVLFSHAAHPVVLGGNNLEVSADYCGYACQTVEAILGGRCTALFFQGCCGNINACREQGDFAQAERLGRALGAAAAKAAAWATPVGDGPIDGALELVDLPLQAPPGPEQARALVAQMEEDLRKARSEGGAARVQMAEAQVAWAQRVQKMAEAGGAPPAQPIALQALRIGDLAYVGSQAETFVEIGQAIQQRSPFPHTAPLGYTNGCIGYLPTSASYPEGGYEVEHAIRYYRTLMWARESEGLVVEASLRLLARIRGAS